jgi:hypothetical protein
MTPSNDGTPGRTRRLGAGWSLAAVVATVAPAGCFFDTTPACELRRDRHNVVIGTACRDDAGCVRYTNLDGEVDLVRCGANYTFADGGEVAIEPVWRGIAP